jgi:hypothetical protein
VVICFVGGDTLVALIIPPPEAPCSVRLPGIGAGKMRKGYEGRLCNLCDSTTAPDAQKALSCQVSHVSQKSQLMSLLAKQSLMLRQLNFVGRCKAVQYSIFIGEKIYATLSFKALQIKIR